MAEIGIGKEIYYRVVGGSPWLQKTTVLGETSRSWLVGSPQEWWAKTPERIKQYAQKIPKGGIELFTQNAYELHVWAMQHRHRIGQLVDMCYDGEKLLEVAKILGYMPLPEPPKIPAEKANKRD